MLAHPLDWPPSVRASSYWLIAAIAYALILNLALRLSEAFSVLFFLLGGLALLLWFCGLCIAGLIQSFRQRRSPERALSWLIAPVLTAVVFSAAIWIFWQAFGLLPWRAVSATDFQLVSSTATPDGKWQALHVEDLSGGPMTGTGEDVYVLPSGVKRLFFRDRVFSAECVQNIGMRWIGPRTLQVEFTSGNVPMMSGLQPTHHIPWLHGRDDEMRKRDPVNVVQLRHLVSGNLC